jgi:hypothetical protein
MGDPTVIGLSLGLVIGTVVSVALWALIGWLVLVVIPRHLTAYARRPGSRR